MERGREGKENAEGNLALKEILVEIEMLHPSQKTNIRGNRTLQIFVGH